MNERDDLPIRQAFDQLTPSDAAKARMRRRLTAVQSAPAPRRQWVLPLTAAVCTALALAAVLLLPKPDAVPTAPAGSDDASTDAEIAVIDKGAMTLIQKYPETTYAGAVYSGTAEIDAADVGEKLADVTIPGCEAEFGSAAAELYAVDGITTDYFLAVRFPKMAPENYYGMWNADYTPETLFELIDDLSLRENLHFREVEYTHWSEDGKVVTTTVYTLPDTDVIWDLLLDTDTALIEDCTMHPHELSVGIDVDTIGYRNISIMLHEDGCLSTNILAADRYFPIGKDKIDAFLAYVTTYGTGFERERIEYPLPPEGIPE